ncbi:MAG: hypothetical protein WAO58_07600 [Fimbriimonadaceae bacterium]
MITALAASATLLLTIQIGKSDITPSESLPMGGYTERGAKGFEPGGDRLYSRAIVLRQGRTRIAVVSVEMLTVPESLVREVRARLPKDVKLFLTATHTHSAPDSQMLNERMTMNVPGIANFRPRWLDWYAERIAGSVLAALGSKVRPIQSLLIKRLHLPLNRGRREGAMPDQTATAIVAGTKPLWFHYAAHAIFKDSDNLKLSGDWPGAMSGAGYSVLTGAIGDASPVADGANAAARIATFKLKALEAIAQTGRDALRRVQKSLPRRDALRRVRQSLPRRDALLRVRKSLPRRDALRRVQKSDATMLGPDGAGPSHMDDTMLGPDGAGPSNAGSSNAGPSNAVPFQMAWASVPIELAPTSAHPDFARRNGIPPALAQDLVSRFAPREARISALRIGSLAVVGIPGEPTSVLGRQIVAEGRRLGFYPVLVVSHVNGWMGYILDPEDYDRGGYEATLSFYGREQGSKVLDAAKLAFGDLRSSARAFDHHNMCVYGE